MILSQFQTRSYCKIIHIYIQHYYYYTPLSFLGTPLITYLKLIWNTMFTNDFTSAVNIVILHYCPYELKMNRDGDCVMEWPPNSHTCCNKPPKQPFIHHCHVWLKLMSVQNENIDRMQFLRAFQGREFKFKELFMSVWPRVHN